MERLTGIFTSPDDACRATRRLESVVDSNEITLLIPAEKEDGGATAASSSESEPQREESELLREEISSGVEGTIPGVGPVRGLGSHGGALLRSLGAAGDGDANATGIPHAAMFVYEDALRRRRSVLTAAAEDESEASSAQKLLKQEGAESVDIDHDTWWIDALSGDVRPAAKAEETVNTDDKFYRLGYEAALHAKYRCKEYDQILSEMQADLEEVRQRHPRVEVEAPFIKGFEQGRARSQEDCRESASTTDEAQSEKTDG